MQNQLDEIDAKLTILECKQGALAYPPSTISCLVKETTPPEDGGDDDGGTVEREDYDEAFRGDGSTTISKC